MANRRVTDDEWLGITKAYRLAPGDHARVSKQTGFDQRTLKKYWQSGIGGRPPIGDVIGEEQQAARAKRRADTVAESKQQVPALAVEDGAATLAEEGRLIHVARQEMLEVGAALLTMATGVHRCVEDLNRDLAAGIAMSPMGRMQVVARYAAAAKAYVDGVERTIQAERTRMGEPNVTVAVKVAPSHAEITEEWERYQRSLARLKAAEADAEAKPEEGSQPDAG